MSSGRQISAGLTFVTVSSPTGGGDALAAFASPLLKLLLLPAASVTHSTQPQSVHRFDSDPTGRGHVAPLSSSLGKAGLHVRR
jgi:hypothetical protein